MAICATVMLHEPDALRFASDATLAGLWGGALLLVAGFAIWGDRRRVKRKEIDAVGWMPWTKLYAISAFAGILLLAMAIKGWLAAG